MSNQSKRILVVDDEQHITQNLLAVLDQGGYIAEIAHTSKQALTLADRNHFNCVLSDDRMPDMSPNELFRDFQRCHPGLPIILMSSCSYEDFPQLGLTEGVVAVINKPLDVDILFLYLSALQ